MQGAHLQGLLDECQKVQTALQQTNLEVGNQQRDLETSKLRGVELQTELQTLQAAMFGNEKAMRTLCEAETEAEDLQALDSGLRSQELQRMGDEVRERRAKVARMRAELQAAVRNAKQGANDVGSRLGDMRSAWEQRASAIEGSNTARLQSYQKEQEAGTAELASLTANVHEHLELLGEAQAVCSIVEAEVENLRSQLNDVVAQLPQNAEEYRSWLNKQSR